MGPEIDDAAIEDRLRVGPADAWVRLDTALDVLDAPGEHYRWHTGDPVDRTTSEGVEERWHQLPFVSYSPAVLAAVTALYDPGALDDGTFMAAIRRLCGWQEDLAPDG